MAGTCVAARCPVRILLVAGLAGVLAAPGRAAVYRVAGAMLSRASASGRRRRRRAATSRAAAYLGLWTLDDAALDDQVGHAESGALQVSLSATALLRNPANPFRRVNHGTMPLVDLADGGPDVVAWSRVQVRNDVTILNHSDLAICVVVNVEVVLG